jgi:hypothetical protein
MPRCHTRIWIAVLALLALAGGAPAQWISYPAPGTPRTRDGKPNLAAQAPRTRDGKPDLSGIWHPEASPAAELLSASGGSRTPPALGSEPPSGTPISAAPSVALRLTISDSQTTPNSPGSPVSKRWSAETFSGIFGSAD